jgi:hypothetical protein
MTRFTFKGDVTWGDGANARQFKFAVERHHGFDQYLAEYAKDAVVFADQALDATITHLNTGDQELTCQFARRYFMVGWLEGADLETVKTRLIATRNGLRGKTFALKIHAGSNTSEEGAVGHTPLRYKWDGSGPPKKKYWYHNKVGHLSEQKTYRVGAIHISRMRLEDLQLACKTIIHEATHKYAGTYDECYFTEDGEEPALGYTLESKKAAMANADSLAWYAMNVWAQV